MRGIQVQNGGNKDCQSQQQASPLLAPKPLEEAEGQPLEEAYAQTSLIYDGVLDDCPNLKIAFAHGGGLILFVKLLRM
jgi:predicted TIM-barrel fold metal-dependent hydrolase